MKKILSLFASLLVTMAAMAIEPIEVVTPGYQPAGAAFGNDNSYTIDWDKQYIKAVIDVSGCTGTSENILSVGEDLDNWWIGGWHFYYSLYHSSYGSNALKVDYLDTKTNGGAHPLLTYKTGVTGTITVEISKEHGVLVNGEEYNSFNGTQSGTWQELSSKLWEATTIQIGSAEGATRSNATYQSLEILPLETEDTVTVVSDTAYVGTIETTMAIEDESENESQSEYKADDTELRLIEMSDSTYRFVFKDYKVNGHSLGDIVVSNLTSFTTDKGRYFMLNGEQDITLDTDDETFKGATFTINTFTAAPAETDDDKPFFGANMIMSGTIGENSYAMMTYFRSEPEEEGHDTIFFDGQMAYTFDMYGDKTYASDRNAVVGFTRDDSGIITMTIKNMLDADGEVMGDFSFKVLAAQQDDITHVEATDVTAPLPGAWSAYNGTVTMSGDFALDVVATADFDINYGGFYTATLKFGPDAATAINNIINTDSTVTDIYTIGGAKIQSLQKGVNIVRKADGKTVKMIK